MIATLLIVDDNTSVRRFCQEEFEADGYRVLLAADGEEALRIVTRSRPDLVVMDIHMPRGGGLEAVEQIRRIDPALPVILHTSAAGDWERRTGLPSVRKTEDLSTLRATIADILSGPSAPAGPAQYWPLHCARQAELRR